MRGFGWLASAVLCVGSWNMKGLLGLTVAPLQEELAKVGYGGELRRRHVVDFSCFHCRGFVVSENEGRLDKQR